MLLTLTYHGADGKRDTVLGGCPAQPPKGEGLFPASASPLRGLKCETFSAPLNKTLEKLYADLGEKGLERILTVVTGAWGHIESAVHAHILGGLGLVFFRYRDGLNIEELTRKLRDFGGGPAKIIAQARGSRELHGSSVPHNVAAIIVVAYNKGRRNEEKRLVDWWTR